MSPKTCDSMESTYHDSAPGPCKGGCYERPSCCSLRPLRRKKTFYWRSLSRLSTRLWTLVILYTICIHPSLSFLNCEPLQCNDTWLLSHPDDCVGQCLEGQFFNEGKNECQNCTICSWPLVSDDMPCGRFEFVMDCKDRDAVCCQRWEYAFYGECRLDCHECVHGKCAAGQEKCLCDEGYRGVICDERVIIHSPTTAAPTTLPPRVSEPVQTALEAWQYALIAVGIVIGIVIFSALLVIASFCQYTRKGRGNVPGQYLNTDNTAVSMDATTTVIDGSRSQSTVTVASGLSSASYGGYLVAPPHTRAYSDLRVPV